MTPRAPLAAIFEGQWLHALFLLLAGGGTLAATRCGRVFGGELAGMAAAATLRGAAGFVVDAGAAAADADFDAGACAPCSDDLMFTARTRAVDATPIAHAWYFIRLPPGPVPAAAAEAEAPAA